MASLSSTPLELHTLTFSHTPPPLPPSSKQHPHISSRCCSSQHSHSLHPYHHASRSPFQTPFTPPKRSRAPSPSAPAPVRSPPTLHTEPHPSTLLSVNTVHTSRKPTHPQHNQPVLCRSASHAILSKLQYILIPNLAPHAS